MDYGPAVGVGIIEEKRGKQLASARRKLSNFRSQRGSDQSSTSSSQSPFSFPIHPALPLTTEHLENTVHQAKTVMSPSPKGKEKALALNEDCGSFPAPATKVEGHKRVGSMGHRRRPSSISHPSPAVPFRTNVSGLYDFSPAPTSLPSASFTGSMNVHEPGFDLPLYPMDASTSASIPLPTNPAGLPVDFGTPKTPENPEDDNVRARFTGFSFGSKPPAPGPRGPSPMDSRRDRMSRTSSPGHSPKPSFSAPGSMNRLSTPLSRPPSLLVTRATPLFHDAPLGSAPALQPLAPVSPTTPPTPARSKRHSHTRSNSISLPNLKLGRPQSYSVLASSPSFPASPVSPDEFPPPSRVANGRKLKFEPSGRGAEAEKQRDESRRKALEKLTGGMSPTNPPPAPVEASTAEISLPAMDDEEETTSPYLAHLDEGSFGSQFSGLLPPLGQAESIDRQSSISPISPAVSPFPWTSPNHPSPPAEQWTYGGNRDREEGLGGLGFGLDLANSKRASMPSFLGVLTEEEEETEEGQSRSEAGKEASPAESPMTMRSEEIPIVGPTPSRLRELHLVSSSVHVSPSRSEDSSHSTTTRPLSEATPTKPFGTGSVGRRPRPLSGLGHAAFSAHGSVASSPATNTTITTPKSASSLLSRRRAQPGSGSRGSSISYKKEKEDRGSSGSSREWAFGRNTSPTLGDFGSPPPISASTQFATWPKAQNNIDDDRTATYPHSQAFGMVGHEDEVDGSSSPLKTSGSRWSRPPHAFTPAASTEDESIGRESMSLDESSTFSWRDSRLEIEMERDAFREDAELWKTRCLTAEESLKAEKVESGVLWERVRKLGDRLSSVSSSHLPLSTQPQASEDSQLLGEMRNQLFSLTSLLEREQREKREALAQVSQLEKELDELRYLHIPPAATFQPVLPSHAFNNLNLSPGTSATATPFGPPSPIITPPTPLPSSPNSDVNGNRMKSWGFPSSRSTTPPKEKRRESFFGLSSVLRRPSVPEEDAGVDLPPIAFDTFSPDDRSHAFSGHADVAFPHATAPSNLVRSSSMTSSASSVVSFLSGYLGRNKPPSSAFAGDDLRRGVLDFRSGCKCCTGDVIEL